MSKQIRMWEGVYRYGRYLLFHDFTRGELGKLKYTDWKMFPIKNNEELAYLHKPKGEAIACAKSLNELKNYANR